MARISSLNGQYIASKQLSAGCNHVIMNNNRNEHAHAGQLNSFIKLRPLSALHDNNNKHAYAGRVNSFTHQRALLVLHARGILARATSRVAGHYSSN
jgi:hypothetical protein